MNNPRNPQTELEFIEDNRHQFIGRLLMIVFGLIFAGGILVQLRQPEKLPMNFEVKNDFFLIETKDSTLVVEEKFKVKISLPDSLVVVNATDTAKIVRYFDHLEQKFRVITIYLNSGDAMSYVKNPRGEIVYFYFPKDTVIVTTMPRDDVDSRPRTQ